MISIHDWSLNQIHPNEVLDGAFSAEKGLLLPWAHREAEDLVLGRRGGVWLSQHWLNPALASQHAVKALVLLSLRFEPWVGPV